MSVDLEGPQAELAAVLQENAELKDKYLRPAASLENARKQTVAAVRQPGYTFEGRVLRPARVAVVRPPGDV